MCVHVHVPAVSFILCTVPQLFDDDDDDDNDDEDMSSQENF